MSNKEKLINYIDSLNFTSLIAKISEDKATIKYDFKKDSLTQTYYCEITTTVEISKNRSHSCVSRMELDEFSEEQLEPIVAQFKDHVDRESAEAVKAISNQETGSNPIVLTKDALKNIGFVEDDIEPTVMVLKSVNREFFVQMIGKYNRMGCYEISKSSHEDDDCHNIFSFETQEQLHVHELILALKLCGFKFSEIVRTLS